MKRTISQTGKKRTFSYQIFETRWGSCGIVWTELGLRKVFLPGTSKKRILKIAKQLFNTNPTPGKNDVVSNFFVDYFQGRWEKYNRLKLDLNDFTDFERDVFSAVKCIPFGETRSYSWVAEKIRRSNAVRAVGNALKKNPIPIVIPCHRVIRKDKKLGGFSLPGGLKLKYKARLLELEKEVNALS